MSILPVNHHKNKRIYQIILCMMAGYFLPNTFAATPTEPPAQTLDHQSQEQPQNPPNEDEFVLDHHRCSVKGQANVQQRVDTIRVNIKPIFNTKLPRENNWLFRSVNALKIPTKPQVVLDDLLFSKGDPISPYQLANAERRLRSRQYFYAARVAQEKDCLEDTQISVDVQDVWTLEPTFKFSKTGDEDRFGYGIRESNFLGQGKTLEYLNLSDEERDSEQFYYYDPNAWQHSNLRITTANRSDGYLHRINMNKAFESIYAPIAFSLGASHIEQNRLLYDQGDALDEFQTNTQSAHTLLGYKLFAANNKAHRLVVEGRYIDSDYSASENTLDAQRITSDFTLSNLQFIYDYEHSNFVEKTNIQQINRIEDINLGATFQLGLGVAYEHLSQQTYLSFLNRYQHFFLVQPNQLIQVASSLNGLMRSGSIENALLTFKTAFYFSQSSKRQFYIAFHEAKSIQPFSGIDLQIGGELGLRGYPNYYQSGDHLQLVSIEQRFFGQKEWFSLFYAGFAAFYDAGRIWGNSALPQSASGLHQDIGFGLRFSSTRLAGREGGGHNIVHLDLASPLNNDEDLDDVQFLVSVKRSF